MTFRRHLLPPYSGYKIWKQQVLEKFCNGVSYYTVTTHKIKSRFNTSDKKNLLIVRVKANKVFAGDKPL